MAQLQELQKSSPVDANQERYDAVVQELKHLESSSLGLDPEYQKKKEKLTQEKNALLQFLDQSVQNSALKDIAKIQSRITAIQIQVETTEKKREDKVREFERKKRLNDETVTTAVHSLNACKQRLRRYEERVKEVIDECLID